LELILERGVRAETRNGPTISIFAPQMRFDLDKGFPLLTTKRVHLKSVIHELLWFIRGETNVRSLQEAGVTIWDEWADENGDLGPVYGEQWRCWGQQSIDQLWRVINGIKKDPHGRRHIVTAWNPDDLADVALPPCHVLFQFYVQEGKLNCHLYQRSGDFFLGVPFNIASYALLTMMIAQICHLEPGEFVHTIGDCHLYENHLDQARLQLSRWDETRKAPEMIINPTRQDIDDFVFEDFNLVGYQPHPTIKAPVSK